MNKANKIVETLSEIQAKITEHENLIKDLIEAGKIEQDETQKNNIAEMATKLINKLEILKHKEKKLNQQIENERRKLSSESASKRLRALEEENELLETQVQDWDRIQRLMLKARLADVRKPIQQQRKGGKRSRKNKKSHKKRAKRTHAKRTHAKRTRAKRARHTRKH
jgi:hypothetical protein